MVRLKGLREETMKTWQNSVRRCTYKMTCFMKRWPFLIFHWKGKRKGEILFSNVNMNVFSFTVLPSVSCTWLSCTLLKVFCIV